MLIDCGCRRDALTIAILRTRHLTLLRHVSCTSLCEFLTKKIIYHSNSSFLKLMSKLKHLLKPNTLFEKIVTDNMLE